LKVISPVARMRQTIAPAIRRETRRFQMAVQLEQRFVPGQKPIGCGVECQRQKFLIVRVAAAGKGWDVPIADRHA